jgi:uncharacterized protein YjbJ (UPF0337 family)
MRVGEILRPYKPVADSRSQRMRQHYRAANAASNGRADMNRDRVKGPAKDIAGNVQVKVGRMTGSTSQQVKGMAKQVEGKLQKGAANLEEAAKDIERKTTR